MGCGFDCVVIDINPLVTTLYPPSFIIKDFRCPVIRFPPLSLCDVVGCKVSGSVVLPLPSCLFVRLVFDKAPSLNFSCRVGGLLSLCRA